jgi:hypothetical protein
MRPSRRNFSDAFLRFVPLTADAYIDLVPTRRELIRPLKHPSQKDFRISWMLSLTTKILSRGMGGVANNFSCHRFIASPLVPIGMSGSRDDGAPLRRKS